MASQTTPSTPWSRRYEGAVTLRPHGRVRRMERKQPRHHVAEEPLGAVLLRTARAPVIGRSGRRAAKERGPAEVDRSRQTTVRASIKTAETHRSNIMRKLKLHSLASLTLYAVTNEIIHVAPQPRRPMSLESRASHAEIDYEFE